MTQNIPTQNHINSSSLKQQERRLVTQTALLKPYLSVSKKFGEDMENRMEIPHLHVSPASNESSTSVNLLKIATDQIPDNF